MLARVRLLSGILLFLLSPLQLLGAPPAPKVHTGSLVGSLTYGAGGSFQLDLENVSSHPVAILRYYLLYEVRLLDALGRKISDQYAFFENEKPMHPGPEDWLVLKPGQRFRMLLSAYSENGPIEKLPPQAVRADYVKFDSERFYKVPEFVVQAKAKVAEMTNVPGVQLRAVTPADLKAARIAQREAASKRLLPSPELLKTIPGASGPIWSPDGAVLAAAIKGGVGIWNTRTWQLTHILKGPRSAFRLSFSADANRLLVISSDSNGANEFAQMWSVRSSHLLQSVRIHSHWDPMSYASSQANEVAYGDDSGKLYLCEMNKGRRWLRLNGHSSSLDALAFSKDGRLLVSGNGNSDEDNCVKLWDVSSRRLLRTFPRQEEFITEVAISPDEKLVSGGSGNNELHIWNAHTGALLRKLLGLEDFWNPVEAMAFSPDGRTLANGSRDATVRLWDSRTGQLKKTLLGHVAGVTSLSWSPIGTILASGSEDGTVKLWRVR